MTISPEATRIAERRPDVVQHVVREAAARHHWLAGFITEHDLPDAAINVQNNGRLVSISATHCNDPEAVVRCWARALGGDVTGRPTEWQGQDATLYTTETTRDGAFFHVAALVHVQASA